MTIAFCFCPSGIYFFIMFCIRSGVSSASVITNIVSTAFPAARKYSIMFGIFPWCRKQDAVSVESAFKRSLRSALFPLFQNMPVYIHRSYLLSLPPQDNHNVYAPDRALYPPVLSAGTRIWHFQIVHSPVSRVSHRSIRVDYIRTIRPEIHYGIPA